MEEHLLKKLNREILFERYCQTMLQDLMKLVFVTRKMEWYLADQAKKVKCDAPIVCWYTSSVRTAVCVTCFELKWNKCQLEKDICRF